VRLKLIFAIATAAVCGAPAGVAALPTWKQHAEATVTIADVYYIIPSYWNVELVPRNPLCRQYKNFQIVIVGRKLFINGVLAYQAKRFDKVYVDYRLGVIVDGRLARIRRYKVLDAETIMLCGYRD
jgi:hypothetical protein